MLKEKKRRTSERLADFQLLECLGIWHQLPNDPGMEVVVKIDASALTLISKGNQVIVQWSCDAIRRRRQRGLPAIYSPDSEFAETLEVSDLTAISVLDDIIASFDEQLARSGLSLRGVAVFVAVLALIVVPAVALFDRIAPHVAGLVSYRQQSEIGERVFAALADERGGECRSGKGMQSISVLERRIFPDERYRLRVVSDQAVRSLMLPGSIIVVGASVLEEFDGPEVVAGYALLELAAAGKSGPFDRFLSHAGIGVATYPALERGIDDRAMIDYARSLPAENPALVDDARRLEEFARAGFSSVPFGRVAGRAGLVADEPGGGLHEPLMTDSQWLWLRDICRG